MQPQQILAALVTGEALSGSRLAAEAGLTRDLETDRNPSSSRRADRICRFGGVSLALADPDAG
jgi:hypothetical protein